MAKITNQQNLYFTSAEITDTFTAFSAEAEELCKKDGLVIGIFQDSHFAGREMPQNLRLRHFEDTWGKQPGVHIIPLDVNQIRSYSILFKGKMDILVFPYGSIFPMDAWGLYSGQTFGHFLKKGGAVLTTGGVPFLQQASPYGEVLPFDTPEQTISVYDKWVSKFGIKFYQCSVKPAGQKINTDFLPSMAECKVSCNAPQWGISVCNSAHDPVPKPPHGNVFPERYPTRGIIPLYSGTDPYGAVVSTCAVLVQDWENGSRRIHFAHEEQPHPLSPDSPQFFALMNELLHLLSNRIFVSEVETSYACYRAGEKVTVTAEIVSKESIPVPVTINLTVTGRDNVKAYYKEKNVLLPVGSTNTCWDWQPDAFSTDEYTISVKIERQGHTVSQGQNGFVIWNEAALQKNGALEIKNQYFQFKEQGTFITGTNYYESTRGEIMWFRPDVLRIIEDFRSMADCGVNLIRPHYHHLKWFRDYLLYQHGSLPPYFEKLEDCTDPLPDERGWRIWDMFIYLSHKYGLIYNGDLFTLVPGEMGDPRGWFGTVEAVYDQQKRTVQKAFLQELEARYRHLPFISWDLFNEPYQIPDAHVAAWAKDLRTSLVKINPHRLLCVGGPFSLGADLDYDCPHGRLNEEYIHRQNRPLLLQELHIDKPEGLYYEKQQGEELRRVFIASLRSGAAGICPWSWTRQLRLWQDSYEHHHTFPMEKWDDRLGLHTHEDGTLKPSGQIFKDIAWMLKSMDFISYDPKCQTIRTSTGTLYPRLGNKSEKTADSIYHGWKNSCFAAMDTGSICWEGQCLIRCEKDCYIYFYTEKWDFASSSVLYIKADDAGELQINRRHVKSASLIDLTHSGPKVLCNIPFKQTQNSIFLNWNEHMSRYWLLLKF